MKYFIQQETLQKALKQRNFSYLISFGLLITNIFLSIKVLNHEEKWVLIPQFEIDQKFWVQGEKYSDEYLQNWAGAVAQEILSVNPASVDRATQKFLEISSTKYGELKPYIVTQAKNIKDNQITTAFYTKDFKVDRTLNQIEVTGTFMTWFGRDKAPLLETKTFLVGFQLGPKGVLLISKFEERKE